MRQKIQDLIERLGDNNISAFYVKNGSEAFVKVISMIPEGSLVGYGDSLTLKQIGVVDALEKGNYTFLNPWRPGTSVEENIRLKKQALRSRRGDVHLPNDVVRPRTAHAYRRGALGDPARRHRSGGSPAPSLLRFPGFVDGQTDLGDDAQEKVRNARHGFSVPEKVTGVWQKQ
jgi:hypothetical protein